LAAPAPAAAPNVRRSRLLTQLAHASGNRILTGLDHAAGDLSVKSWIPKRNCRPEHPAVVGKRQNVDPIVRLDDDELTLAPVSRMPVARAPHAEDPEVVDGCIGETFPHAQALRRQGFLGFAHKKTSRAEATGGESGSINYFGRLIFWPTFSLFASRQDWRP
jgi:hypothetical protein